MTVEELAKILNNCQIGNEVSAEIEQCAKLNDLVIVFGASDDLLEFRGAIDEEFSTGHMEIVYLDDKGLIENKCDDSNCPYYLSIIENAVEIISIWGDVYDWSYLTSIPHKTFNVLEDEHLYCQGIVFSMSDLRYAYQVECQKIGA